MEGTATALGKERFFTEEHDMFRRSVRAFVEKEIAPHVDQWESEGIFPNEVFKKFAEQDLLGICVAEEYGGLGLDYWYTVAFVEELVTSRCAGMNMGIMVQTDMATPIIATLGTHEQKKLFLEPAVKGEKIAALGVSEPVCGSDVAGGRTTAVKDGDDYIINGSKTFITNGTRADFITLLVKTDPEAGYGGISMVLFPTDTAGFSVGRSLKKIGNWASDTAEIFFDNCRIPQSYRLGDEGAGFYYMMQHFQRERLVAAVSGVAGAQQCLDEAIKYGRERKAFGKNILRFQVWQQTFAQLLAELEAARRLTYHAVDLFNRGIDCVREVSMAKLVVGELANKITDRCLQFHGGYGYMDEYKVSRAWRDMRLLTIGGGTSEIMREIIAKLEGW